MSKEFLVILATITVSVAFGYFVGLYQTKPMCGEYNGKKYRDVPFECLKGRPDVEKFWDSICYDCSR